MNPTGEAPDMNITEHDTEALLVRVREIITTARPMPLSSSVLISRDEVLELMDDAIERLPEELRRARWLLKEREEFLAKAHRESDEIVETARSRAERMVQRTEVVREADRRARMIIDEADAASRQMQREAEDYVDHKLAGFEVVLERTMQAVNKGRDQLKVHTAPEEPEEDPGIDGELFDQDSL